MENIHPSGYLQSIWLLSYIWDHSYIPLQCLVHAPYQLRGSPCTHLFLPPARLLFAPGVHSEPVSSHLSSHQFTSSRKPFWQQATTGFIQSQQVTIFHTSSSIIHYEHGHSITLISYLTSMWLCPSKTSQYGMWHSLTDSGKGQPQDHIPESGDNNLIKEEPLLLFLRHIINMRSEDSLSVELNRKKLLGARIKDWDKGNQETAARASPSTAWLRTSGLYDKAVAKHCRWEHGLYSQTASVQSQLCPH